MRTYFANYCTWSPIGSLSKNHTSIWYQISKTFQVFEADTALSSKSYNNAKPAALSSSCESVYDIYKARNNSDTYFANHCTWSPIVHYPRIIRTSTKYQFPKCSVRTFLGLTSPAHQKKSYISAVCSTITSSVSRHPFGSKRRSGGYNDNNNTREQNTTSAANPSTLSRRANRSMIYTKLGTTAVHIRKS